MTYEVSRSCIAWRCVTLALTRLFTCGNFGQTRVQQQEGNAHNHPWALLTLIRHLERGGVSMAYKLPKLVIYWRCGTL
jgi:hypothetical protein